MISVGMYLAGDPLTIPPLRRVTRQRVGFLANYIRHRRVRLTELREGIVDLGAGALAAHVGDLQIRQCGFQR
jgi:hypothetical protein